MFKNRIRDYRELRQLSQTQLAKKVGVSKSAISMYEAGKREPSFEIMEAIADTLNASFYDLIGKTEECYIYGVSRPVFKKVPRLGRIHCGEPVLTEEYFEGMDDVPEGVRCDFSLLCVGDSMTDAGINDGDIVYIRQQPDVETGQIAAVWIDGETTLKRVYHADDTVTLVPANPRYAPIVLSGDRAAELRILGLAVAFTRVFVR